MAKLVLITSKLLPMPKHRQPCSQCRLLSSWWLSATSGSQWEWLWLYRCFDWMTIVCRSQHSLWQIDVWRLRVENGVKVDQHDVDDHPVTRPLKTWCVHPFRVANSFTCASGPTTSVIQHTCVIWVFWHLLLLDTGWFRMQYVSLVSSVNFHWPGLRWRSSIIGQGRWWHMWRRHG